MTSTTEPSQGPLVLQPTHSCSPHGPDGRAAGLGHWAVTLNQTWLLGITGGCYPTAKNAFNCTLDVKHIQSPGLQPLRRFPTCHPSCPLTCCQVPCYPPQVAPQGQRAGLKPSCGTQVQGKHLCPSLPTSDPPSTMACLSPLRSELFSSASPKAHFKVVSVFTKCSIFNPKINSIF